jgi:hypothetical protein
VNTRGLVKHRLRAIALGAGAPLLTLVLYWPGLTSWFQKDDFVWLGLRTLMRGPRGLLWVLFTPMAQGTIRTLSERAVYLSLTSVFGLHALPFRCLAFATCAVAIVMLSSVATKLTGSPEAGFWAAIVWTVNSAIAIPLAWGAVYYELLWPFWLLLTFWLLLRYVETGERQFFIAQCVTFVLGFFVLETNVVYPAIAAAYAIASPEARARGLLKKVLPMFVVSLIYTILHIYFAPLPADGPYRLHWNLRIFQTLTTYWGWALGPGQGRLIGIRSTLIRSSLVWILTAGLFAFLFRHDRGTPRDRQMPALFFPAWFLIALAPLLPLRDHISPEYLTAPALGLAMWAGWAIVSAWRASVLGKIAAIFLLAIYAGICIPVGQAQVRSFHDRSQRVRNFVLSVVDASRAHPGTAVFLEGVSTELFNDAIYDHAFLPYGIDNVHLVPENRSAIAPAPHFTGIDLFFVNPVVAHKAVRQHRAMVLDVSTGTALNATGDYAKSVKVDAIATRVDVGNELYADQLGEGWDRIEHGFRWMGKRATVTLAGPTDAAERLYVTGYAPAAVLKDGPVSLQVSIDGFVLSTVRVRTADDDFAFDFEVPARFLGAPKIELAVEVDRTFTASGDPRVFGLVFGTFEIR